MVRGLVNQNESRRCDDGYMIETTIGSTARKDKKSRNRSCPTNIFSLTMLLSVFIIPALLNFHIIGIRTPVQSNELPEDDEKAALEKPGAGGKRSIVEQLAKNGTKITKDMMFLNITTSSTIKNSEIQHIHESPFTIDILIIGSQFNTGAAQAQMKSWASHDAVRHFFHASEFDDPDPGCSETMAKDDVLENHVKRCKSRKSGDNYLAKYMKSQYARVEWLRKKKNPAGWVCAQRRFGIGITKLMELYSETKSFPDYLILADDDTYINLEHIVEMMLRRPRREELTSPQNKSVFPTQDTPVVYAGCRVRHPDNQIQLTFSFGGYGTFYSKGALKRLVQPLYCNETATGFEEEACRRFLKPDQALIGEEIYFQRGESVNTLFHKYIRNVEHFCLHSDWFTSYIVNYYNISRHVVHNGEWFDNLKDDVPEERLHMFMGGELYRGPEGNCKNGAGTKCSGNATICHYQSEDEMHTIHAAALKILL